MSKQVALRPVRVDFHMKLPLAIKKEGRYFIASCPILDVHSQGTTEKKAEGNLKEAVGLFLGSCFERGTLERVLKDCGFKVSHELGMEKTAKGKSLFPGFKTMDVPLPLSFSSNILQPCLA